MYGPHNATPGMLVRSTYDGTIAVTTYSIDTDAWYCIVLQTSNRVYAYGDLFFAADNWGKSRFLFEWNVPWTDLLRTRYLSLRLEGKA